MTGGVACFTEPLRPLEASRRVPSPTRTFGNRRRQVLQIALERSHLLVSELQQKPNAMHRRQLVLPEGGRMSVRWVRA
jgi:hypothetical protein